MSETLSPSHNRNETTPMTAQMDIIVNGPEAGVDNREPSRAATVFNRIGNVLNRLQVASENIGQFFTQRAVNKAHTAALSEYRSEHYLDYVGHINKLADSEDATYQEYAQPIADREAPRAERTINKLHDEALKEYRSEHRDDYVAHVNKLADSDDEEVSAFGRKQSNRERRRDTREQFYKDTKQFARSTGAAALETAKTAGYLTVGAGVVTGEGAKSIAETGAIAAMYGYDAIKKKVSEYAASARIRRDIRRQKWDNNKTKLESRGREAIKNRKHAIGARALRAAASNH